jgi:hypothetical protein
MLPFGYFVVSSKAYGLEYHQHCAWSKRVVNATISIQRMYLRTLILKFDLGSCCTRRQSRKEALRHTTSNDPSGANVASKHATPKELVLLQLFQPLVGIRVCICDASARIPIPSR